jgi:hypothetical protein
MKKILIICFLSVLNVFSMPVEEKRFLQWRGLFNQVLDEHWKTFNDRAMIAAQVEVESRWNPKANLKTAREEGIGFSQTTITYKADGTIRYNNFEEFRKRYKKQLSGWTYEDKFNPRFNLIALTLVNKTNYASIPMFKDADRVDAMVTGYNSGMGTILKAYSRCVKKENKEFCSRWLNGSQNYVALSKVSLGPKYGNRSPYDINKEYPVKTRSKSVKYKKYFK